MYVFCGLVVELSLEPFVYFFRIEPSYHLFSMPVTGLVLSLMTRVGMSTFTN